MHHRAVTASGQCTFCYVLATDWTTEIAQARAIVAERTGTFGGEIPVNQYGDVRR